MKASIIALSLSLILALTLSAQVNFDTLTPNTWAQVSTSGQWVGKLTETHLAFDTSGNAYMIGSCSYGGSAEGTHNADIFRVNVKTGKTDLLYNNATDPWAGGCQAPQVFDSKRNCVWFGASANYSTTHLWSNSGGGGLYRMWCATDSLERLRDDNRFFSGANFWLYDSTHDLIIGVGDYSNTANLRTYDIKNKQPYGAPYYRNGNTLDTYAAQEKANATTGEKACAVDKTLYAPDAANAGGAGDNYHKSACFDGKRHMVVILQWTGGGITLWFYNTDSKTWSSKTPVAPFPQGFNYPPSLAYEPVKDKYVLLGTTNEGAYGTGDWHPELWAYDYDSNAWTQRPRGNMHYDTLSHPENSTWPAVRMYPGNLFYSQKDNILVNWGGYHTNSTRGQFDAMKMNVWTFKLGEPNTTGFSEKSVIKKTEAPLMISANPNPFNGAVKISFSGTLAQGAKVLIHDPEGRLVADLSSEVRNGNISWNSADLPAGVYVVTVKKGGIEAQKKIFLFK